MDDLNSALLEVPWRQYTCPFTARTRYADLEIATCPRSLDKISSSSSLPDVDPTSNWSLIGRCAGLPGCHGYDGEIRRIVIRKYSCHSKLYLDFLMPGQHYYR